MWRQRIGYLTVSPRISVPTCLAHPCPDAVKLGGRAPFNDSGVFIFDVFAADDSIHLLGFFEKRKFLLRTDYLCSVRNVARALWRSENPSAALQAYVQIVKQVGRTIR